MNSIVRNANIAGASAVDYLAGGQNQSIDRIARLLSRQRSANHHTKTSYYLAGSGAQYMHKIAKLLSRRVSAHTAQTGTTT